MNTKSILLSLLFAASTIIITINCSGNKKDASAESHDGHESTDHASSTTDVAASQPQFQVDEVFQKQLANLFLAYVKLKDAFVSSDASKIKEEVSQTTEALSKVEMKLLSGVAHHDWMNYLAPMQSSLNEIQASADIEEQRKSFSTLSDNLYKSIKAFGLGGHEAFYEFCPMAFNNEGAYWLSDQPQIRNPYFGDKMLTCGSVKEKLK
jgi:Cu(I)/Ag(I) efflux system membrane fusion protein